MTTLSSFGEPEAGLRGKLFSAGLLAWAFIALVAALGATGVLMLYSVAGMSWEPWAGRHMTRFAVAFLFMLALAFVPVKLWRLAAYPVYFGALLLLVAVEFVGETNMGATRWLKFGTLQIQPAEIMKIALVLAIARYYGDANYDLVRGAGEGRGFQGGFASRFGRSIAANMAMSHWPPLMMIAVPVLLIARQPDLGTAMLSAATGMTLVFLSGLPWRHIVGGVILGGFGLFGLYAFGLHDYQRKRILSFLDPASDPMGAGYHSLQSKIAIGSGGLRGKGLGEGTQTQLDFLPEKHTDFIFTVVGEELGLTGGVGLLALIALILVCAIAISLQIRHQFGRLAAIGVTATFAFYVLINIAMVMGLAPVVGVPLPLVSYGGTVMVAVMIGFGIVLSMYLDRDQ